MTRLVFAPAFAMCAFCTMDAHADVTSIGLAGDTHGVLVERLRGELGARGFEVRTLESFEPADALPADVAAVLRVESAKRRVEVWTTSGPGEAARFRTTIAARGADATADDDTIAVRAAEDVRAYLDHPIVTDAPMPPAVKAEGPGPSAEPAVPRPFSLGVDAALLLPQGGPSASGEVFFRARHFVGPRVALGVRGMLPIVPATLRSGSDSATMLASGVGPEAYVRVFGGHADSDWDTGIAAGLAAMWIRTNGTADAPHLGRRDDALTAMPFASLEVARALAPNVRLRASAFSAVAVPAVTVRFAGTEASTWGGPLLGLALGADLNL